MLRLQRPYHSQALKQFPLAVLALLGTHHTVLDLERKLEHLGADAGLVVELALGLLGDLVSHPDRTPDRRQGQRDECRDQSHLLSRWVFTAPATPRTSTAAAAR